MQKQKIKPGSILAVFTVDPQGFKKYWYICEVLEFSKLCDAWRVKREGSKSRALLREEGGKFHTTKPEHIEEAKKQIKKRKLEREKKELKELKEKQKKLIEVKEKINKLLKEYNAEIDANQTHGDDQDVEFSIDIFIGDFSIELEPYK